MRKQAVTSCLSVLFLLGVWPNGAAAQQPPAGPATITPAIVESASDRMSSTAISLGIVIRDVDAPDRPLDGASIVVERASSGGARAVSMARYSNNDGAATLSPVDSGEYSVLVRRVGYRQARVAVRVRPACKQVLEVYVAADVLMFDRNQVVTATVTGSATDRRERPPETTSPNRAVFTTCTT
jgi:hypothetical protein